jgi:multidrug efflux pump subunit AcrB
MEGIIQWFSRNHVAANFLMAAVLLLGITTWGKLKKEFFPEMSVDMITVTVPFPTATPEEVEKGICVPIEEAIQDLDGIDRLKATAAQGAGTVIVEVANGYDVRSVMDDVKSRVDAIQNFAEEAEEPLIEELLLKSQILSVAVSAETDEKTLRELAERVREGLLAYQPKDVTAKDAPKLEKIGKGLRKAWAFFTTGGLPKITQVELAAVRDHEISIEVSEETLRQYGLTFDQVANAVRSSSLDLPGGSVRTDAGEILIRTEAKSYTEREFRKITVVTQADGSVVTLGDITDVRDSFEQVDIVSRFDGRPAILINVFRVGDQDTNRLADLVQRYIIEEAPKILPPGVEMEMWQDMSELLRGRMNLLTRNGILGLLYVFIVLALFLRPSLALLVVIGIPVSFAGAIMMMPYTGISINMISLFGFILVLGIVVDDAIVVGENVYSRIRSGEHPRLAAPRGTHEVGVVVIFGILTTAMAFTPMLGLSGVSGKIWPNIPLIVIPTLMFSLVQSKLILPAHLAMLSPYDPDAKPGPIMRVQHFFSRGLERFVEKFYRPTLRVALHHRYIVLSCFISLFLVTIGLVASGWIKFQFFPIVEAESISAKLTMAKGVPFERTETAITKLEAAAEELGENFRTDDGRSVVRHILANAGVQPFVTQFQASGVPKDSSVGEVTIELVPSSEREGIDGEKVTSEWRRLTGEIPGVVDLTFQTNSAAGGNAIDLELSGPDLDDLQAATLEVKKALAEFEGVIDIGDSDRVGKRELKLAIRPEAEAMGLRLQDVARQVRQGFYGDEIQRLQRGRDEVKVFVRYPEAERKQLSDLAQMKIRTRDGGEVPFSTVATAEFGRTYSKISRTDRSRSITITADIDKATNTNANEVVADLEKGVLVDLRQRYSQISYSFEGEQKDQRQSVQEMMQKFVIALLGMYVLMAIPLRSYMQPLIVMSVIPFGLVGAVFGHWVMGFVLSIMSLCGMVALAGVVVNDSLVLVDYVNRQRAKGKTIVEAASEAGARRFRPILLTSLTTFAGLTPMLLETEMQAQFLIPMAVSLSFGILFATIITLILVPCVYLMLNDVKKLVFAPESSVWDRHPQDVGRAPLIEHTSSADDEDVAASGTKEEASA